MMNFGRYTFFVRVLTGTLLLTVVFVLAFRPLTSQPFSASVIDGAVAAGLLTVLGLVLVAVIKYANTEALPPVQRYVNYGALAIMFVICWVGLWALIMWTLLSETGFAAVLPTLYIRILLGFAAYGLIYLCTAQVADDERNSEPPEDVVNENKVSGVAIEDVDNERIDHVAVKNGSKIVVVQVAEIVAVLAEGDYVMIYTLSGRHLKEQTMKYFQDILPPSGYVRVHRSAIVNVNFITRIETYEKQRHTIIMRNELKVGMSLNGYKELKKVLNL